MLDLNFFFIDWTNRAKSTWAQVNVKMIDIQLDRFLINMIFFVDVDESIEFIHFVNGQLNIVV